MPKRILTVVLIIIVFSAVYGCSSFLDGEKLSIFIHEEQTSDPQNTSEVTEVTTYFELTEALLNNIDKGEKTCLIRFYNYDGDVSRDVEKACREVPENTPLGAYSVYYMSNTINRIVSYYEAEISISYKRTISQIDNIVSATSLSAIKLKLSSLLREYGDYLAIYTNVTDVSESELVDYINYLYYNNPQSISMLPNIKIQFYPDEGPERILEVTFEFAYSSSALEAFAQTTSQAANQLAESISGVGDGEILLSMCQHLMDSTNYDEDTAQNVETQKQIISYTAYGALVEGNAVGEGYAIAYKILCDILDIKCYVVLGKYNDMDHAWNIVELDGDFYHVDVSMCDKNGIESAFLINDTNMNDLYSWDTEKYVDCEGSLTYEDIVNH